MEPKGLRQQESGDDQRLQGPRGRCQSERRGGAGRDSGDFYQKGTQLHGKLGRFCVSTKIASMNGALANT